MAHMTNVHECNAHPYYDTLRNAKSVKTMNATNKVRLLLNNVMFYLRVGIPLL